ADRAIWEYRACLEHVRIAPQCGRFRTVYARDQQHSVVLRRQSLVDVDDLLAARKYGAFSSGKIFLRKQARPTSRGDCSAVAQQSPVNGCGRQTRALLSRICRECWGRMQANSAAQGTYSRCLAPVG